MRTSIHLALLAALTGAGASFAIDAPLVRIDQPQDRGWTTGECSVRITVGGVVGGTWRLLDETGGQTTVLADGGTDLAGAVVYQGVLAPGAHRLRLEANGPGGLSGVEARVAQGSLPLAGWPCLDDAANSPYDQPLMAEWAGGALLARPVDSALQGLVAGQLTWLDGSGAPLPGWPVDLASLQQSIGPHSAPLALARVDGIHLLSAGKTGLLELDRAGRLVSRADVAGQMAGEPILLPVPGESDHVLLWTIEQNQLWLNRYSDGLVPLEGRRLDGQPAWPRPLLGDLGGDGRLDVLLPVRVDGALRLDLLDLSDGVRSVLWQGGTESFAGLQVGDLDADGRADVAIALDNGRVLVVDAAGTRWSRQLPATQLGALALVDADGDARQELALLARDGQGVWLAHLDPLGQPLRASGTRLGTGVSPELAPQLVKDPAGARFLVCLQPDEPAEWAARLLWVGVDGSAISTGWWLPTRASGPPRLVDVDADGALDVLVGDSCGRWIAWPADRHDPRPPHPLGDARHAGLSVQGIPAGSHPELLAGRIGLPGEFVLPAGVEVRDVDLASGTLVVREPWAPASVAVDALATLRLELPAAWTGEDPVPVVVDGCLRIVGERPHIQEEIRGLSPSNRLLKGMALDLRQGSRLELQRCTLDDLPAPLDVPAGRHLWMESCALLAGACGIRLSGGTLDATGTLFQPGDCGVQVLDGSVARLRGSVITAATGPTALACRQSGLELRDCSVLACSDGVLLDAAVAVLDSVHFQGNQRDLVLANLAGSPLITRCDFMESHQVSLCNGCAQDVATQECYWEAETPSAGPVIRQGDRLEAVKPLVVPEPVFVVRPGPMVDGDEPLEWAPVKFSVDGIPIHVDYRIYRSDKPWGVAQAANLVATTPMTMWRDPRRPERAFYAVTASLGKSAAVDR